MTETRTAPTLLPVAPQLPDWPAQQLPPGFRRSNVVRPTDETPIYFRNLDIVGRCAHLQDELGHNIPVITRVTKTAAVVSVAATGYGIVGAYRHSTAVPTYAKATTVPAVLFGVWAGWEQLQGMRARDEWNALQCKAVLAGKGARPTEIQAPEAEARVAVDPCWGADVLIRGCHPASHIDASLVWVAGGAAAFAAILEVLSTLGAFAFA